MSLGEGGGSQEMDTTMYEIVGSRSKEELKRMQKAALSGTLNIARTFKVVTWETIDCYRMIFLSCIRPSLDSFLFYDNT